VADPVLAALELPRVAPRRTTSFHSNAVSRRWRPETGMLSSAALHFRLMNRPRIACQHPASAHGRVAFQRSSQIHDALLNQRMSSTEPCQRARSVEIHRRPGKQPVSLLESCRDAAGLADTELRGFTGAGQHCFRIRSKKWAAAMARARASRPAAIRRRARVLVRSGRTASGRSAMVIPAERVSRPRRGRAKWGEAWLQCSFEVDGSTLRRPHDGTI